MNIEKAIRYAEDKVKKTIDYFYDCFPTEQSKNYVFGQFPNVSWTTGFYSGILWLMYELTGDAKCLKSAKHHSALFRKRLDDEVELEHHDMGFLFSLSSVADYPESNGILKDGMYSRRHGHEPECTSWGDYFYLEALMRMHNENWNLYW